MSRTRGTRSADTIGVDGFKSTPVVNPGSFGTSSPSIMSSNIVQSAAVPAGIRDPLISSRYVEVADLNPNQITTVGDGGTNLGWTMVRTDRPVLLWPIKSRLSTASEVLSGTVSAVGSGYVLNQTLTVSGGTGTAATFTSISGRVTACNATPTVYGTGYVLGEIVTLGAGTLTAARLPTARVTAVAAANSPTAVTIVNPGTGYVTGDVVTIVGGGPTAATATLTVTAGVVTAATISGTFGFYTTLPPQVASVTGGTGTGLTLQVNSWTAGQLTFVDGGAGITAPNTCPATAVTVTSSSGVATSTVTISGYALETVTRATGGSYTVLPSSNPVSITGGSGSAATIQLLTYGGTSGTSTTFNSGSPRVIYYAPNRIPVSADYTQRSKGAGIVYLPNPGTWYLQHARDNTAEAITTEYIVIDAQDPAVIARYLAESGCHRVKTSLVACAGTSATTILSENRNRTGLLITFTGALQSSAYFNIAYGQTATSSVGHPMTTAQSTGFYQTGEQVWKGSVSAYNTQVGSQNIYVTEWE